MMDSKNVGCLCQEENGQDTWLHQDDSSGHDTERLLDTFFIVVLSKIAV